MLKHQPRNLTLFFPSFAIFWCQAPAKKSHQSSNQSINRATVWSSGCPINQSTDADDSSDSTRKTNQLLLSTLQFTTIPVQIPLRMPQDSYPVPWFPLWNNITNNVQKCLLKHESWIQKKGSKNQNNDSPPLMSGFFFPNNPENAISLLKRISRNGERAVTDLGIFLKTVLISPGGNSKQSTGTPRKSPYF